MATSRTSVAKATATNLCLIDRPADHDIEAVKPFMRRHMRPWKLLMRGGGEVTINGRTPKDAIDRFRQMTGGTVAYVLPKKAKR